MWQTLMRRFGSVDRLGSATLRSRSVAMPLLAGIALAQVMVAPPARSQSNARPQIEVAGTVTAGAGETRLAIAVSRTEGMPRGSFIRIRGLPPDSSMSEGFAIAPSLWAVPLNSLPNLKIKLSTPLKADLPLTIALATVDGDVLAEARAMLRPPGATGAPPPVSSSTAPPKAGLAVIAPVPVPARPPASAADPGEPPPPPPDPWTAAEELPLSADQVRALGFITRAREQMAEGNIAVARLLFERAAKAGLAYGALGMAETFDTAELARQKVLGMPGDAEAAKTWYRLAAKLGAVEAEDRLKRLGN